MKKRSASVLSRSSSKTRSAVFERLEDRRMLSVSQDAAGFTVVTPSSDSQLIYVSSSGSDTNTGLSASSPLATIAKAYGRLRNGYPDWILLKRGDTYHESFANFADSGRSQQEPAVVTDYGDPSLPRPIVDAGANNAFVTGKSIQHVDVIGIAFTTSTHNPSSPNFNGKGQDGCEDDGTTTDLLVEDCSFSYFVNDINLVGNSGPINNITIRRCEILDSYSNSAGTHSQGMFAAYVDGLSIEDNVFDHDGWNTSVIGATPTIFNHDCYLHSSNNGVVVTNNIFADASSFGLQARAGGIVDNNVFVNNAHGMSFGLVNGATTRAGGVSGEVEGNVYLADRQDPAGWGFGLVVGNLKVGGGTAISNNIFANGGGALAAIQFQPGENVINPQQEVGLNSVTVNNNIVYNWGFDLAINPLYADGTTGADGLSGLVVRDNQFQNNVPSRIVSHGNAYDSRYETWSGNIYSSFTNSTLHWFQLQGTLISLAAWQAKIEPTAINQSIAFADPTRSVATYMGWQGQTATLAAFIAGARTQCQTSWNPLFFASAVATYIQGGFGVASSNSGSVSGTVTSSGGAAIAGAIVYVDIDSSNTFNTGDLSATTNGNGAYTINNIPAGAQTICQVLPTGDTQTTPTSGSGIAVTVTSGGSLSNENFVDTVPAASPSSVSGSVTTSTGVGVPNVTIYLDANNNGKLDSGELFASTDSSGAYVISNVSAGMPVIRQVLPSGDTQVSPASGYGIHVTVTTGVSFVNQNFIDTDAATTSTRGSVSGYARTSAGIGIAGITIYLDNNSNGKLDSGELFTKTSSTGAYSLSSVPAGATVIRQILPTGDRQTTPGGGYGIHITITAGGSITNQNFIDTVA